MGPLSEGQRLGVVFYAFHIPRLRLGWTYEALGGVSRVESFFFFLRFLSGHRHQESVSVTNYWERALEYRFVPGRSEGLIYKRSLDSETIRWAKHSDVMGQKTHRFCSQNASFFQEGINYPKVLRLAVERVPAKHTFQSAYTVSRLPANTDFAILVISVPGQRRTEDEDSCDRNRTHDHSVIATFTPENPHNSHSITPSPYNRQSH